eukprot:4371397-Karenia_brevis.AAC.1
MLQTYLDGCSDDIKGFAALLSHVPCVPVSAGIQGHSWLEILSLAIAWGSIPVQPTNASPQPSLARRLRTFVNQALLL